MENTKKLAEDYYNFILKYDECFYKKYKKEETETVDTEINEDLTTGEGSIHLSLIWHFENNNVLSSNSLKLQVFYEIQRH